jgi:hypothetical protein
MGTSIVNSSLPYSFSDPSLCSGFRRQASARKRLAHACQTPQPLPHEGQRGKEEIQAALCGPAVQRIQGFLIAQAMPNSIQPTILRQTRAHLLHCLFRLLREGFDFTIELLVADLYFFFVSNLL